jgi:hypothetical protein
VLRPLRRAGVDRTPRGHEEPQAVGRRSGPHACGLAVVPCGRSACYS